MVVGRIGPSRMVLARVLSDGQEWVLCWDFSSRLGESSYVERRSESFISSDGQESVLRGILERNPSCWFAT